jgi:AraC family transcriptional regulator
MKRELPHGQFYGRVLRSREVATLSLIETRYASGQILPRHSHERPYFCFVIQGRFAERYRNRNLECQPSTLVFHPLGDTHSDHFQTEARCFNIQLDTQLTNQPTSLEHRAEFRGGPPAYLATKLYREFHAMDEVSELAIEGLTLEIIAEAARSMKRVTHGTQPWLVRARELLHAQFAERLTIAQVAAAVGVHPTHLAREFHRRHKRTIGEYVRQLRIEFACHELCNSVRPLSEIALTAGFFDQSHFARTFKLFTGLSPAAYRRTFQAR